jgi:fibronectin type 3 domain-containing protein
VICWGDNGQGQTTVPATLKPCVAVACGDFHTIALQQDGVAVAWGYNQSSQAVVPPNTKFTQLAGGGSHSMGLTSNIAIPTGVTATDGTSTANVTVNWTATAGASGYRVFRAVGTGLGVQIGTTTTPVTFVDATATAGVSYTYWVKTITANGDSVASATNTGWRNVAVPTGVAATDGTLTTGVTVTWSAVTGAAGYRVYRAIGAATPTLIASPTTATYTDTTAVAGTVYTYSVCSRTAAGITALSASNTGWRNLAPPATVAATDGTSTTRVRVTWTAVTGATGYVVYRQLPGAANASIATIASGTTLLFDDTTIAPGVVGTYRIRSRSAAGLSAYSTTNTGFRATAFTGDPSSGGSDAGEDGAPAVGPLAADGTIDPAGAGRGRRDGGTMDGDHSDRPMGRTPDVGREDRNEPGLRAEHVPCSDIVDRVRGRIAWLRGLDKDNLAASAEADALECLLPEFEDDGMDRCTACRMARGDVNLDGRIDGADLGALLGAFAEGDPVMGDLNRDGWMDTADLALVLAR